MWYSIDTIEYKHAFNIRIAEFYITSNLAEAHLNLRVNEEAILPFRHFFNLGIVSFLKVFIFQNLKHNYRYLFTF